MSDESQNQPTPDSRIAELEAENARLRQAQAQRLPPRPVSTDPSVDERIKAMQDEIARLKTNPRNLPTHSHCNVCGESVPSGERCERHPNEKVNHIREGLPGEADFVLVKQV